MGDGTNEVKIWKKAWLGVVNTLYASECCRCLAIIVVTFSAMHGYEGMEYEGMEMRKMAAGGTLVFVAYSR